VWGVPPTGAGVAADPATYYGSQSPTAFGAYEQQQMGQQSSSWMGTSAPLAPAAAPAAGGFAGVGSGYASAPSHTAAGVGGTWVGGFGAPRMESYASGDAGVGLGALTGGAVPYLVSGELSQEGQGAAVPPIAAGGVGGGGSFSTWVPGTHAAAERAVAYTDSRQLLGYSLPSTAAPSGFGAGPSSSLPSPSVGAHAGPAGFGAYDQGQCSNSTSYNPFAAQQQQHQQLQQHWQHAQQLEHANASFQNMSLAQQASCAVPASPLNRPSSNFSGASYDPGNLSNSTSGVSNYSNYSDPVAAADHSQQQNPLMQPPLTAMATDSMYTVASGCRGNCTSGAAGACGGGVGWCGGHRSPSGPVHSPAAAGGGFGGFHGAQMQSQQYDYTHGQPWQQQQPQQQLYGNGIEQQQQQQFDWTQHQPPPPGAGGQQQQQHGGAGWM